MFLSVCLLRVLRFLFVINNAFQNVSLVLKKKKQKTWQFKDELYLINLINYTVI